MSEHGHPEAEAALPASGPTSSSPTSSGLTGFATSLENRLKPFYTGLGYLGAAVLGLLIVAMMYSVIGRRFFNSPLPGSADIIEMSLLVMTALVIGIEHLGHEKMTVDVLVKHLPKRAQQVIAPIIFLLGIAILCMAVWQLIRWGIRIQARGETTPGTLALPKYPFAYLAAFGIFTMIPIYVARLLTALDKAVKR